MPSDLPTRPNLEHLKKQARERLRERQMRVPGTDWPTPNNPFRVIRVPELAEAESPCRRGEGLEIAAHSSVGQRGEANSIAETLGRAPERDPNR